MHVVGKIHVERNKGEGLSRTRAPGTWQERVSDVCGSLKHNIDYRYNHQDFAER